MSVIRSILFLLFLSVPVTGAAGMGDLPENTVWYLHADLAQMRSTTSGQRLYSWLDGEVLVDIHDEIGIDLNKEVNSLTAFSGKENGTIIIVEGPLSGETEEKLLALARDKADVQEFSHGRQTYFHISDDHDDDDDNDNESHRRSNGALQDLEDGAFLSFALKNKLVVAGSEAQMKELLDNNGKVAGSDSHNGALFVLTADKSFVQAGLNTDSIADDGDDDWDSKILRNTEHAALMVSDFDGMIAIEAQLVSSDADMAAAIGSIASGLIAMQAFNTDLDPGFKALIANTKIDVSENVLSVNTVIAPELIVSILEN